jgi:hypothetical protein
VGRDALDAHGGTIKLTGTDTDAKLDSHPILAAQPNFKVDTLGLRLAMPQTEITSLDVDGQLVLTAVAQAGDPSDLVVGTGKIRLVHTTDASRTQEMDVTDTRFVSIVDNRVIIKPPFDFDFGGAYRVHVDRA